MGKSHAFRGIRNQIPGHKGIFHADMPHSNAVAYRNSRKDHRHAPCLGYPKLYRLHNFIQIHMPWHNLIIGTDNAHHRLFHLLFRKPQGVKQAPVGCLLHTAFYIIASHIRTLSLFSLFLLTL